MKKYLNVFTISLSEELAYKTRFVMERVRNLLQIFLLFFLWNAVFQDPETLLFGYNRAKILTYVFGIIVLKAVVANNKVGSISGIIASGDFINYLLKPLNLAVYWFTRDISAKVLGIVFALIEAIVLYYLVRPPLFLQTETINILFFLILVVSAILIFYLLLAMVSMIPFWMPEQTWPATYLFLTVSELLSGAIFPLDVFPAVIQKILYLTPFPYLIFVPLQTYLGLVDHSFMIRSILISLAWLIILSISAKRVLKLGLKEFRAEGR